MEGEFYYFWSRFTYVREGRRVLPGLVSASRIPVFAAEAATEGEEEDAAKERETQGHGGDFLPRLARVLMAREHRAEGQQTRITPVFTGQKFRIAQVLMSTRQQIHGRDGAPEDQVDQVTPLQHATCRPERNT